MRYLRNIEPILWRSVCVFCETLMGTTNRSRIRKATGRPSIIEHASLYVGLGYTISNGFIIAMWIFFSLHIAYESKLWFVCVLCAKKCITALSHRYAPWLYTPSKQRLLVAQRRLCVLPITAICSCRKYFLKPEATEQYELRAAYITWEQCECVCVVDLPGTCRGLSSWAGLLDLWNWLLFSLNSCFLALRSEQVCFGLSKVIFREFFRIFKHIIFNRPYFLWF